jgi:lipopolysaccharide export system permease protein
MNMHDRSSHTIDFETYDIRLDLRDVLSTPGIAEKQPDEMTLTDLRAYLKHIKDNRNAYFNALLTLHKKFSIPVACLAMGLLALPLGIQSRNSKKAFGIGLGLLFFLLYYILLSMGTALGENGKCHPAIGMWMPDTILGGVGVFLLVRAAKEKTITLNVLAPVLDSAIRWVKRK